MIVATVQDLGEKFDVLGATLEAAYGMEFVQRYHPVNPRPLQGPYSFEISPSDESSFFVRLAKDRRCLLLDGLAEQNGRAVMVIVKALPDVDPIMLADPDGGEFCILTPDMTADDIATQRDWRPISEIDRSVWG